MKNHYIGLIKKILLLFIAVTISTIRILASSGLSDKTEANHFNAAEKLLITITVNVSLSNGESPAGTLVHLVGKDNPNIFYFSTAPESGIIVFTEVVETVYFLRAYNTGFYDHEQEVTLYVNQTIDIQMAEIRNKPRMLSVDGNSLKAIWEKPLAVAAEADFESGFPPPGWQATTSSAVGWYATDSGSSQNFYIPPHTRYAVSNDDAANDNGCCDYLITPAMDLTGHNNYYLKFSSFFNRKYGHNAFVKYSVDDGQSWTFLPYSIPVSNNSWKEKHISLADFSGISGVENLRIAFHSDDDGNWGSGWAIDDVLIAADSIQPLEYAVFLDGVLVGNTSDTTFQFENLELGQQYIAGVSALYSSGYSEHDTCSFTSWFLFPARNTSGIMPVYTDYVHLTWDAPENPLLPGQTVPGLTGFSIYRNDSLIALVNDITHEYFDMSILPGFYHYKIKAVYDLTSYGFPGQEMESIAGEPINISWICCYFLPFIESFNTGLFETNMWNAGDNWKISGSTGNPAPSAEFSNMPAIIDYNQSLTSFMIIGTDIIDGNIFLEFDLDHALVNPTGTEFLAVEVFNGSIWVTVAEFSNTAPINWQKQNYRITGLVKGKLFNIRFRTFGSDVSNIVHWKVDNIHIYRECAPPTNFSAYNSNWYPTVVELYWESPMLNNPTWLHYDDGQNDDAIGLQGGGTFSYAIKYTAQQLVQYAGSSVTKIKFFPCSDSPEFIFNIWEGNGNHEIVCSQYIDNKTPGEWNEFELVTPFYILPWKTYLFGFQITHNSEYGAGVDNGPAVAGFGDLISLDGISWESMATAYALDYNWNIQVKLEASDGKVLEPEEEMMLLPEQTKSEIPVKDGIFKKAGLTTNPGSSRQSAKVEEREFLDFAVYRDNVLIGTTTETYYNDSDSELNELQWYTYFVTARYQDCEARSDTVLIQYGAVSVSQVPEPEINLYPNPANDILRVEFSVDVVKISVINYLGKTVFKQHLNGDKKVFIDTSNFDAGVYLVKLQTREGKTITRKMVVAK
ncbi:MAG: hypothetical protein CVT94_18195 [Bacteroidetes bacterium HGW-Bacteroidetes-11]|jgi:hypothetical protein|nr:MAG: hypothetical protein CVT94_18195 [Bacteroidetes bacterium HGW-Bacteroidetes-11]